MCTPAQLRDVAVHGGVRACGEGSSRFEARIWRAPKCFCFNRQSTTALIAHRNVVGIVLELCSTEQAGREAGVTGRKGTL